MWRALLCKEWRECSIFAGLAFLAQLQVLGEAMDLPLIGIFSNGRNVEIPLLSSHRELLFTAILAIAAVIFGFQQTLWESWRQTTLVLLHRPVRRDDIFLGKLVSGVLLLLAIGALPLFVYCLWAAYPATHASPYFWSMSEPWWRSVGLAIVWYLGAFLSGLRPARWIGSRLLPAIAAATLVLPLKYADTPWIAAYMGIAILSAILIWLILDASRLREYP